MATTTKKKVRRKKKVADATDSSAGAIKAATKKKARPSSKKKPLRDRRETRRAKQFPEGTYNPQLMVPTMRFMCIRCGESKHVVWSEERRQYVHTHGGLPCEVCGDKDLEN